MRPALANLGTEAPHEHARLAPSSNRVVTPLAPSKRTPARATVPLPPSPPASAAALAKLAKHGLRASLSADPPSPPAITPLDDVLRGMPRPNRPAHIAEATERATQLMALTGPHWSGLSAPDQRAALALFAAYARHIQAVYFTDTPFPTPLFHWLTEFSERERPGHVHGLAHTHYPHTGSWLSDAQAAWKRMQPPEVVAPPSPERALRALDKALGQGGPTLRAATLDCLAAGVRATDPRLTQRLAPHLDLMSAEPRLRDVRRALRKAAEVANGSPEEPGSDRIWPHTHVTSRWRAVLIGGDNRRGFSTSLKEVFGFAGVRWVSGRKVRQVSQVCAQLKRGNVQLCLLMTRFVSHKASEPVVALCRRLGVPVLSIGGGNNVDAVWSELLSLPEATYTSKQDDSIPPA